MITKYIEKIFVYLLTFIITIIGIKYIFTSKLDKEIVPLILLAFFLIIMFIYIYYMNKKNEKLDEEGIILKRDFYYTHKYNNDDLNKLDEELKLNKLSKEKYNNLVYGNKKDNYILIPFSKISNIRKIKNKYFMHVESLRYDVEITNYKILKHLQELK